MRTLATRTPARALVIAATVLGLVAELALASSASADQVFHTQNIPLQPVNGATFRSGFVVDIHANGQQVFALERYVLNGAASNTRYQVQLVIFLDSTCSGTPIVVPSAQVQTNGAGNGEAAIRLTPQQVVGFRGITISIIWQVLNGTVVNFQTGCTVVVQD